MVYSQPLRRLTVITQLHSENPTSKGMQRPIDILIKSLALEPEILILGDEQAPQSWPALSKGTIDISKPHKNVALDFVAGLLGRYRIARRQLHAAIGTSATCIVSFRASPLLIFGATLLKSDLFSVNYRRRASFSIRRDPKRLPVELVKLLLAIMQETAERMIYRQFLLHSALETQKNDRFIYLPIIATPINCKPANELVVKDEKILVVGYPFEDPIANTDTDEILEHVISNTGRPERVFYFGHKSDKINDNNQVDWVEDYEAFLGQFSVAVYARRICSGAHNKIVDLLNNGCTVYCSDEMRSAFATPCRYLRPLESFRQEVGANVDITYDPEDFRSEVDRFFQDELNLYRSAIQKLQNP